MNVLLFLWQLPQIIIGYVLTAFIREDVRCYPYQDRRVVVIGSLRFLGGVSFGHVIFLHANSRYGVSRLSVCHEYGHCRQSKMLGWFYLPIVGLYSGVRCGLRLYRRNGYYNAWCERWADQLGGVKNDNGFRHL